MMASKRVSLLLVALLSVTMLQIKPSNASQDSIDSVLAADWLPSRQDNNLASLSPTLLDTESLDRGDTFDRGAVTNSDYHRSTCQLVKIVHLLSKANCQPKAIASYACSGSCRSYVQLSRSKFWQHERSCSCCQQTGLKEATFTLDCPASEPPYQKVKTYAPVDCMCRACTDLGKERLQPQELVEALAGEGKPITS